MKRLVRFYGLMRLPTLIRICAWLFIAYITYQFFCSFVILAWDASTYVMHALHWGGQ